MIWSKFWYGWENPDDNNLFFYFFFAVWTDIASFQWSSVLKTDGTFLLYDSSKGKIYWQGNLKQWREPDSLDHDGKLQMKIWWKITILC